MRLYLYGLLYLLFYKLFWSTVKPLCLALDAERVIAMDTCYFGALAGLLPAGCVCIEIWSMKRKV